MANTKTPATKQLPKLADLHKDINEAFKTDQLNLLLNQPPHETWLKNHPTAKVKNNRNENVSARYLPIDKVEFLMTYIFGQWKVEVLDAKLILNSAVVTIRLHYLNPVTGEWSYHDGVGAKSVQLDAGAKPSDLSAIKSEAVMMAVPSAKSYAIKDAAEHLGPLFGRDLNRRDIIEFVGAYTTNNDNAGQDTTPQQPAQVQQPATPIIPIQPPAPPAPQWNGNEWINPTWNGSAWVFPAVQPQMQQSFQSTNELPL